MNTYISHALLEAIQDRKIDEGCEMFRNFPLQRFDLKKVWKNVVKEHPDHVDMDFLKFFIGIPDDESYKWVLYYAIKVGKLFLVKKIVEENNMNIDITFKKANFYQNNPLVLAASYDHPLIVSYLLSRPMGSNASNVNAIDGFISACAQGNIEVAEIFLNDGRFCIDDVDSEWGSTALMHASQQGHHEIVRFLLKLGADPCLRSRSLHKTAIEFCPPEKAMIQAWLYKAASDVRQTSYTSQPGVAVKDNNEELTKKMQVELQNEIYYEIMKKMVSSGFVLK